MGRGGSGLKGVTPFDTLLAFQQCQTWLPTYYSYLCAMFMFVQSEADWHAHTDSLQSN